MTDINRLKNEARRHEQREQWPLAIELYSKAIDAIEDQGYGADLSLYNRVGDLYLRQGETARAVSFYERAVDRYAEQGLQTSAVALCNKVLRIAPGRSEIYRTLGRLHAETGLQSQARRSFMEYASRMEKAGELDAAIEALDEFVKLSADEEARTSLGRYLIEQDRVPDGLTHLRQVVAERSERGEDSSEIEALIEQVAPADAEDDSDQDIDVEHVVSNGDPVENAIADDGDRVEDNQAGAAPMLSEVEAAELDQIIADLGELGVDDDVDDTAPEPAELSTVNEPEVVTLGASITVTDSTLHDLLDEFQEKVVATIEETDSSIHYDLGIAYREMGLLDDAIREFTTAIQNDQRLLGAHQLLAESLIEKGQYDAGVGAMAEYVRAVGPPNDVTDQMERMNELLRASPSEETLTELKQLLRSISDPASPAAENGAATVDALDEIDVNELFPDLEEAWEATTAEGSPDDDLEAIETEAAFEAPSEAVEEADSELDAVASQVETEDAASSIDEEDRDDEAQTLEEGGEPEAPFASVDAPEGGSPASPDDDLLELDEDGTALEALSEALGEPVETWDDSDDHHPTWDPDALDDDDHEPAQPVWEPEASWEAESAVDMEAEPEPQLADEEPQIHNEELPEEELELDVADEAAAETGLEADIADEAAELELHGDEAEAEEPPEAEEDSEDLGGLLFGARLAKFRARMARSARETDFQAHYDLGLAYKEVALFDEAIAELLVAITGPDSLAKKSLRLMSEVAHLAADESLHLTTADHLREHGMTAEALEHLSRVYDDRTASGGDIDDILGRINAIDPLYIPAAGPEPQPAPAQQADTEPETGEIVPEDLALVAAGFDSILEELSVADPEPEVEAEVLETVEAEPPEATTVPEETEAPQVSEEPVEPESEEDELTAWELRTAELLEDGHRDNAIRELYRLQAAYEAQEDLAGAMRAVSNLLLLDPEDVILHHQQVEYAIMLDDRVALATAHLDLGRCLQRQGASSNARTSFESVLEIDADNEAAMAGIAELDEDFADDDPVDYGTHYELGVAFKKDGLHDEAVYELELAARGLDDPVPAYELLGELFNEAGEHETTSKVLGRALEANGRDDSELAGVLYQLGISYQELGEIERAKECFGRVFAVDSEYRQVSHRLDQCSL